jgi:hypothetical protein
MTKPTETAQEWLELCQMAIAENLPFNQIPFPAFLGALKECLPCQMQIGDNPPITVVSVGNVHPVNFSLSYRGDRESDIDGSVLGGGIGLKSARILEGES